jgi:glycosyltransferase involved in cell wall biosynthesis
MNSGPNARPVVSICIPTYNMGRWLEHALSSLVEQKAALTFPFEVFISDNASSDNTPEVIQRFSTQLPIRSIRQAETIPMYANYTAALSGGTGEFLVYLAADDELILESVANCIARMQARPSISFTCAPWFVERPGENTGTRFFKIEDDIVWQRGDYRQALADILRRRIWPEIMIWRGSLYRLLQPRERPLAYWAFANIADVLRFSEVRVQKEPFYRRLVHPEDAKERATGGAVETMEAWDRYRGGLEYLLGAANSQLNDEQRKAFVGAMTPFVGERMAAAVRIRHVRGHQPVETYDLAVRAIGLGFGKMLEPAMRAIAQRAALHFLFQDGPTNNGIERVLCIGEAPDAFKNLMRQLTPKPLEFADTAEGVTVDGATLVFLLKAADATSEAVKAVCAKAGKVIPEIDLVARFRWRVDEGAYAAP